MIPLAKEIKTFDGKFVLGKAFTVKFDEKVVFDKELLTGRLSGYEWSEAENADVVFVFDEKLTAEGYRLEVGDGVNVSASSSAGAFYGWMTFAQMMADGSVQKCVVCDEPRFNYRGIMLDVARHFFDKNTVKRLLDDMAFYKLNVFHWHLTEDQGWRIEIKKYSELARVACKRNNEQLNRAGDMENEPYGEGCFFTQEDVKEIVDYAAKRNITVIPEIDMPGHITSALSVFPELSCEGKPLEVSPRFGIKDTIGCVGNPDLSSLPATLSTKYALFSLRRIFI